MADVQHLRTVRLKFRTSVCNAIMHYRKSAKRHSATRGRARRRNGYTGVQQRTRSQPLWSACQSGQARSKEQTRCISAFERNIALANGTSRLAASNSRRVPVEDGVLGSFVALSSHRRRSSQQSP